MSCHFGKNIFRVYRFHLFQNLSSRRKWMIIIIEKNIYFLQHRRRRSFYMIWNIWWCRGWSSVISGIHVIGNSSVGRGPACDRCTWNDEKNTKYIHFCCCAGLLICLSRPAINEIYLLTISYFVMATFVLIDVSIWTTAVLQWVTRHITQNSSVIHYLPDNAFINDDDIRFSETLIK